MKRIRYTASGDFLGDEITTRFEPWPHLPSRFMVYKNGRSYPMCRHACDEAGLLHAVPEIDMRTQWEPLAAVYRAADAQLALPL